MTDRQTNFPRIVVRRVGLLLYSRWPNLGLPSGVFRFGKGEVYGERVEREHIMEVWGRAPGRWQPPP